MLSVIEKFPYDLPIVVVDEYLTAEDCVYTMTYSLELIDCDNFAAPVRPNVDWFGEEHRISPVTSFLLNRHYCPQIDVPINPILLREI